MLYKYVLFDLDGTITEPVEGITNAYMYALKKFGIEISDRSELYKVIGPPLRMSLPEYYGLSEEDTETAIGYYREYYGDRGLKENEVMPGIEELLVNLRNNGIKTYVATSKPEEYAKEILKNVHLDTYFDYIAGSTFDSVRDNKIAVMEYLLEIIKKDNEDFSMDKCLMIGDRYFDIDGAKHFDMDSVGVLFGYGSREEFESHNASYIVENACEIATIVGIMS